MELGRALFHEKRLSRDASRACSSCHDPGRAFTNGEMFGEGVNEARGTRNVPALLNRAWGKSFFWDGRAATLEDQAMQPILHPDELAMTPPQIVALARSERYRRRFETAFEGASVALPGERPRLSFFTPGTNRSANEVRTAALSFDVRPLLPQAPEPAYVTNPYAALSDDDARTLRQTALRLRRTCGRFRRGIRRTTATSRDAVPH